MHLSSKIPECSATLAGNLRRLVSLDSGGSSGGWPNVYRVYRVDDFRGSFRYIYQPSSLGRGGYWSNSLTERPKKKACRLDTWIQLVASGPGGTRSGPG